MAAPAASTAAARKAGFLPPLFPKKSAHIAPPKLPTSPRFSKVTNQAAKAFEEISKEEQGLQYFSEKVTEIARRVFEVPVLPREGVKVLFNAVSYLKLDALTFLSDSLESGSIPHDVRERLSAFELRVKTLLSQLTEYPPVFTDETPLCTSFFTSMEIAQDIEKEMDERLTYVQDRLKSFENPDEGFFVELCKTLSEVDEDQKKLFQLNESDDTSKLNMFDVDERDRFIEAASNAAQKVCEFLEYIDHLNKFLVAESHGKELPASLATTSTTAINLLRQTEMLRTKLNAKWPSSAGGAGATAGAV